MWQVLLAVIYFSKTDSAPGTVGIRDVLTSWPSPSPSLVRLVLGDRNVPSDPFVEGSGGRVEQCEESRSGSKSLGERRMKTYLVRALLISASYLLLLFLLGLHLPNFG